MAAACTFFLLLSVFPFLLFALNMTRFFPDLQTSVTDFLNDYSVMFLPEETARLLRSIVTEIFVKASGTVLPLTMITALWSAGQGLLILNRGFNKIAGRTETRGFLRLRLAAVFWVFLFAVVLCAVILLLGFGTKLHIHFVRWVVAPVILTLFFWALMKGLPGAALAGVGWVLFSAGFAFYIERFANYSYIYGSLTAVVVFMLWLYFCVYILFVGARLNHYLSYRKKG